MRNVLILEDNDVTRSVLYKLIEEVSGDVCIHEFSSMNGIYDFVLNHTVELFLIDIIIDKENTGDTSGLKFAEKIRKISQYEFTPIIFITSLYDPKLYAYSSIHSYEYIEKPFDNEKVKVTIRSALRFPKSTYADKTIHFRMDGTLFIVKCSEILYIESYRHKIYVYRSDGSKIIAPYKSFEQILLEAKDTMLEQCSRSVIINKAYLEYVDWANSCIKLKNMNETIRIGITFKQRLKVVVNDL